MRAYVSEKKEANGFQFFLMPVDHPRDPPITGYSAR
jgi:hypothetical protein